MKSFIVSNQDALEHAMDNYADEIIIEGELAEKVNSAYTIVRTIKKLLPFVGILAIGTVLLYLGLASGVGQAEEYEETALESGSSGKVTRTVLRKNVDRK